MNTHLKSHFDLADITARNAVFDDVDPNSPVEQIQGGLQDANVRFDSEDDDVSNIPGALEPFVRDAWQVHAELGLRMYCRSRELGKLFDQVTKRRYGRTESC